MKIHSLLALSAIAALTLAGCNKETEVPQSSDPDAGLKSVTLVISGANLTKANMTPDENWIQDAGISRLDIYFTNATGVIQNAFRLEDNDAYPGAWDAIQGNGVRFIGLESISRVYVVANSPETTAFGSGNISQVDATIDEVKADLGQDEILYFGADLDLTPIGNEVNEDVTVNIGDEENMASQYYTANVAIRPVISRLEISKIGVQVSGSKSVTLSADEVANPADAGTYTISWTGFTPKLSGIYMSNFFGKVVPVTPAVSELFETPAGSDGIAEGKWATATGITAAYNANAIAFYSNYEDGSYGDLFANSSLSGTGVQYYFDGSADDTCVPFNFIVPFDPTQEYASGAVSTIPAGVTNFVEPKFHFQFFFESGDQEQYTVTVRKEGAGSDLPVDSDLYIQLTSTINFTTVSDGQYFANVAKFDFGSTGKTAIEPNTIYKMNEVVISPFNVSTGTVTEDAYNVIVKVTAVPYATVNVTPDFDQE